MAVDPTALLRWYVALGVDEAIGDAPIDRTSAPPPRPPAAAASSPGPASPGPSSPGPSSPGPASPGPPPLRAAPAPVAIAGAADTRALAASCQSLAELEAAIQGFDGCA